MKKKVCLQRVNAKNGVLNATIYTGEDAVGLTFKNEDYPHVIVFEKDRTCMFNCRSGSYPEELEVEYEVRYHILSKSW